MERNVPVPASVVRDLAEPAKAQALKARNDGRTHTEKSILEAREHAYEQVHNVKGSTLVSVKATHLSTLTAFSEEAPGDAREAADTFLHKFGVWE